MGEDGRVEVENGDWIGRVEVERGRRERLRNG